MLQADVVGAALRVDLAFAKSPSSQFTMQQQQD